MKILVVSDAHGNKDLMIDLINEYPNMDLYLDAGDSLSDSYTLYPYRSVKGNCDFFDFDEKALIRNRDITIFMRHAPYIYPNEEKDIDIFIHGHTHRYEIVKKDNYIILCPGSLSRSRDDSNGSYALIEVNDKKISIDIIDVFTKKVLLHF